MVRRPSPGGRLGLLVEAIPGLARVFMLWDRLTPDHFEAAREAGRTLNITVDGIECIGLPYDYDRALADVDGADRDVLLQTSSPFFMADRARVSLRWPSVTGCRRSASGSFSGTESLQTRCWRETGSNLYGAFAAK